MNPNMPADKQNQAEDTMGPEFDEDEKEVIDRMEEDEGE